MSENLSATGIWRNTGLRPAVILGNEQRSRQLAAAIQANDSLGLVVTDFLELDGPDALSELLLQFRDHVVLIAPEPKEMGKLDKLLPSLTILWPKVGMAVPALHTFMIGGRVPTLIDDDTLLIWASNGLAHTSAKIAKRAIDIVGSSLGLLLFAPLFLAMIFHRVFTGQPVFYGHKRVGRFGQPFICFKFRTMVTNAAEILNELLARDPDARREWDATYKLKNDPRVTTVGRFLRRTSLDELPQLWNVLKGDMSLVGPRPIVQDEVRYYGDQAQNYLSVKPGLTGVWQISGRTDTSYDERVSLDRWYVTNWSLWYDIVIIVKTIGVMFRRSGAY